MIYLGNGMYSDSGPNDELMHYGVIGMRWGHRKALREADSHTMLMRNRLMSEMRKKYRTGGITKDRYKRAKRMIKADARAQRARDRSYFKDEARRFRTDKAYREEYKKKYKKRSDRALAIRNELNKANPGFAELRKEQAKNEGFKGALKSAAGGMVGGAALGAVMGANQFAREDALASRVKTPKLNKLIKYYS